MSTRRPFGAYSPGPKDRKVDESWPTGGIATSFYSRHKAEVERLLDDFEQRHPDVRVVRLRPALIFKREAGSKVRRLFAGPLLPNSLLRRYLIPLVPNTRNLRFQAVHSYDVGDAYRLALVNNVSGAFNIAADPVLGHNELAQSLDAKPVGLPPRSHGTSPARHLPWLPRRLMCGHGAAQVSEGGDSPPAPPRRGCGGGWRACSRP